LIYLIICFQMVIDLCLTFLDASQQSHWPQACPPSESAPLSPEAHSDGKHAGYVIKMLANLLGALGYDEQLLYIDTPITLRDNTYA
jgi:hypothetical protein